MGFLPAGHRVGPWTIIAPLGEGGGRLGRRPLSSVERRRRRVEVGALLERLAALGRLRRGVEAEARRRPNSAGRLGRGRRRVEVRLRGRGCVSHFAAVQNLGARGCAQIWPPARTLASCNILGKFVHEYLRVARAKRRHSSWRTSAYDMCYSIITQASSLQQKRLVVPPRRLRVCVDVGIEARNVCLITVVVKIRHHDPLRHDDGQR